MADGGGNMANKVVKTIPATKPMHSTAFQASTQKRRVAAYARVSTDKEEQESSFEAQVNYYTKLIRSNPEWIFVEVYADEGISGTSTKKREGFTRMIDDALAGHIDLILTKSVSRFARNTVDSLTTVRKLKEKGVEVYFEKENIYTLDSKGELLITIMSSLAQEEARNISENTAWGRRKQFAEGKHSLAYKTFLGYDKGPDGGLVVNEGQAEIVRRIYSEFLSGRTPYMIAKGLTADGIKTPGGKDVWRSTTIRSILTNEKYYGAAILQKTVKPDVLSPPRKNTGELPSYYIAEDHEPIVSEEMFRIVGEELKRRSEAEGKAHGGSVFSGRIVCADCGGFYGRKVWHSGSKYASSRWHCNNRFAMKTCCRTPTVKEEDIEAAFIRMFNGIYYSQDLIKENWQACLDAVTDTSELEAELERIMAVCNDLQTLMKNALIESGKMADAGEAKRKYEAYQTRLQENAAKMAELEEQRSALNSKRIQAKRYFRTCSGMVGPMVEFDPLAWQAMVDHASMYHDGTITFFLRDGTEKREYVRSGVRPYKRQLQAAAESGAV